MKYQHFSSGKSANVLNEITNNVEVAFETNSNLIKTINKKSNFTKRSQTYNYDCSGVYKFICSRDKVYTGRARRNFKIRFKEHISEVKYN